MARLWLEETSSYLNDPLDRDGYAPQGFKIRRVDFPCKHVKLEAEALFDTKGGAG